MPLDRVEDITRWLESLQARSWGNVHEETSRRIRELNAAENSQDAGIVGGMLDAATAGASDTWDFAWRNRQTIIAVGALVGYVSCPVTVMGCAVGTTLTYGARWQRGAKHLSDA
jgi:hypothetical protein